MSRPVPCRSDAVLDAGVRPVAGSRLSGDAGGCLLR